MNTDTSGYIDRGTFNVKTQIVKKLNVTVTQDLEFGDMVVPDNGKNNTKETFVVVSKHGEWAQMVPLLVTGSACLVLAVFFNALLYLYGLTGWVESHFLSWLSLGLFFASVAVVVLFSSRANWPQ